MSRPTYCLDGAEFDTLEGFYDAVERGLLGGLSFGRNLDALNDVLRGEFGPLPREFALVWRHAELSRRRLGHGEAARQLELRLGRCHPSNVALVERDLRAARRGEGPTVFDWLVEIIREHENVEFRLA